LPSFVSAINLPLNLKMIIDCFEKKINCYYQFILNFRQGIMTKRALEGEKYG